MLFNICLLSLSATLCAAAPQFGFGSTSATTTPTYTCSSSLDSLECCTAGGISAAGLQVATSDCTAGTATSEQGLSLRQLGGSSTSYTCPADTTAYCCLVDAGSTGVVCSAATASTSELGGL